LTATGGFLFFKKVPVLLLENMDRSRAFSIWVSPSEPFSISYVHSIYKDPVVEEFQVHQGAMVLKGVRTNHPGILEYYQYEDMKEFHPMDRKFGALFFRIGMGEAQRLTIRDKEVFFSGVGEKGDRVRLGLGSVSLGRYLFHRLLSQTGTRESN